MISLRCSRILIAASLAFLPSACATSHRPDPSSGLIAEIPVFAADDARVNTAGFVGETLRLHRVLDGVRYTLMAFVVGDTLTLGAMVRGPFEGLVRWKIDGREFGTQFDSMNPPAEAPITLYGAPDTELTGRGAEFQGTSWINVELPASQWIEDGSRLRLTFRRTDGALQTLPGFGVGYDVRLVRREAPPATDQKNGV